MESKKRPRDSQGKKILDDGLTIVDEKTAKYAGGPLNFNTRKIKHKHLKKTLQETRDSIIHSAARTASTEILLAADAGCIQMEDDSQKVYKLTQSTIRENVDMNTAKNAFDLQLLNFGPYCVDYSRNNRYLILGGRKGHVAVMDCLRTTIGAELQLQQEINDVQYLQNETLFAVAQSRYTYIYDYKGVEIHCMRDHERPYKLQFLPYHYLLSTVGHSGWVKWHDVSTGEYVAGYQTGHGPCRIMKQNPKNAVLHLGHSNGVVTLWSPSAGKPLVSMFCHQSPVTDVAVDRDGLYMATAGMDGLLKIWDLRKYTCLHTYRPDQVVKSIDISDRGMMAIGVGRSVQILSGAFTNPSATTYIKHEIRTPNAALASGAGATAASRTLLSNISINNVRFRPYEDVLAIGHSNGVSTIIVPGSGEPNFDSFESNPFMNPKQRQEAEVQSMLHKLSPDMICLDPTFVGSIDKDPKALAEEQKELFAVANHKVKKEKNKMRGKNKISAKLQRKQKNVIDAQTIKLREKLQKQQEERMAQEKAKKQPPDVNDKPTFDPLRRFQSAK